MVTGRGAVNRAVQVLTSESNGRIWLRSCLPSRLHSVDCSWQEQALSLRFANVSHQSEAAIYRRCIWPEKSHRRSRIVMTAPDPKPAMVASYGDGGGLLYSPTPPGGVAVTRDKALLSRRSESFESIGDRLELARCTTCDIKSFRANSTVPISHRPASRNPRAPRRSPTAAGRTSGSCRSTSSAVPQRSPCAGT